ncbi:MAG: hypothetical protein ACE5GT_07160 [Rhodospirillales bacterium]
MKRLGFFAAALLIWLAAPPAALGDGMVSAISFRPLPTGAAILVRALDNAKHNLVLREDFERVLKQKGYTLSDHADLVLTFETLDAGGAWTGGGENRLVELSNNHDQTGIDAPRVRLNLFNSARGGLLNPNRRDQTRTVTPSQYRIDVTIDDKTNGKRLWEGWTSIDIGPGDNRALTRTMVPVLVDSLGKTVRQQTFPLQ